MQKIYTKYVDSATKFREKLILLKENLSELPNNSNESVYKDIDAKLQGRLNNCQNLESKILNLGERINRCILKINKFNNLAQLKKCFDKLPKCLLDAKNAKKKCTMKITLKELEEDIKTVRTALQNNNDDSVNKNLPVITQYLKKNWNLKDTRNISKTCEGIGIVKRFLDKAMEGKYKEHVKSFYVETMVISASDNMKNQFYKSNPHGRFLCILNEANTSCETFLRTTKLLNEISPPCEEFVKEFSLSLQKTSELIRNENRERNSSGLINKNSKFFDMANTTKDTLDPMSKSLILKIIPSKSINRDILLKCKTVKDLSFSLLGDIKKACNKSGGKVDYVSVSLELNNLGFNELYKVKQTDSEGFEKLVNASMKRLKIIVNKEFNSRGQEMVKNGKKWKMIQIFHL